MAKLERSRGLSVNNQCSNKSVYFSMFYLKKMIGSEMTIRRKILSIKSSVILFFCFILFAGNYAYSQTNFTQKQREILAITKPIAVIAGVAKACGDADIVDDAQKVHDGILFSATKNKVFVEEEINFLKSLTDKTVIEQEQKTIPKLTSTRTHCERAVRELKYIKNKLGLLEENGFDSIGLICAPCNDDSCEQISPVIDAENGKMIGLVMVLTDMRKGKLSYSPEYDELELFALTRDWSVFEQEFSKSDKSISVKEKYGTLKGLIIDRRTGLAVLKSKKYKCEPETPNKVRVEWFTEKRKIYLNGRKF